MTDLEMTRLCAEAMEYHIEQESTRAIQVFEHWPAYDPLRDDAHAMALVKKVGLHIGGDGPSGGEWLVVAEHPYFTKNTDLNRAIVECVAKMRQAKAE